MSDLLDMILFSYFDVYLCVYFDVLDNEYIQFIKMIFMFY